MISDEFYRDVQFFHRQGPSVYLSDNCISIDKKIKEIDFRGWFRSYANFFWHFEQNKNLIDVHQQLLRIKVEELHLESKAASDQKKLVTNLERLNQTFAKANHFPLWKRVAQSIVNWVKKYIFFQTETKRYEYQQGPIKDLIQAIRRFDQKRAVSVPPPPQSEAIPRVNIKLNHPLEILEIQPREGLIHLENFQVWTADNFPSQWRKGEQISITRYKPALEPDEEWYTFENLTRKEKREFRLVNENIKQLTLDKNRYINANIRDIDNVYQRIKMNDGFTYNLPNGIQKGGRLSHTWYVGDSVRIDTVNKVIHNQVRVPRSLNYHE